MEDALSLTGVWHGLYSYPRYLQPVYFVATLISSGGSFSGLIHEAGTGRRGAKLELHASVSGTCAGSLVAFDKIYDGTGGWSHRVRYAGDLNADRTEIEGQWSIPGSWGGRFLMIRGRGADEEAVRRVYEQA